MAAEQAPQKTEWYSHLPAPRAKVTETTAEELMKAFDDMDIRPEPRSFLLIDVRRVDWEVCSAFLLCVLVLR